MSAKKQELLKANVIKPGSEFRKKLEGRLTMTEFKRSEDAVMFTEDEDIIFNGKKQKVKRLFIRDAQSNVTGVGWIINEDITACMVCSIPFGMFRWPHHCRSCGNIVCNNCSPYLVAIVEMLELGEVRVCVQCYWGQDTPIHAVYQRPALSRESSIGDHFADLDQQRKSLNESTLAEVTTPLLQPGAHIPIPEGAIEEEDYSFEPNPAYAIFFIRALSPNEANPDPSMMNRFAFVNICTHEIMNHLPEEQEFVICDECFVVNDLPAIPSVAFPQGKLADIYHAVLRPDVILEELSDENEEQYHEVSIRKILM